MYTRLRRMLVEAALVDDAAAVAADVLGPELPSERRRRADLQEPLEDHPDDRGLRLVDDQLPVLDPVAHRHEAAHPHAALAGGGDLVADALADHLALELGEGQQHVQRQPAHAGRGVEGLRDADEGDAVPVEHLDQPGEIHQRAAQPVDLVDDHDVDAAGLDVGEEALQGGPFERAAGEPAIVVLVGQLDPALGPLAGDVGAAGLALGVEAVELHVEPFLGRLARVDGAAELADDRLLHAALRRFFRPKKVSPFQRVPVIARAIADSDLYGRPCHS